VQSWRSSPLDTNERVWIQWQENAHPLNLGALVMAKHGFPEEKDLVIEAHHMVHLCLSQLVAVEHILPKQQKIHSNGLTKKNVV
jgi:hypothetical protein